MHFVFRYHPSRCCEDSDDARPGCVCVCVCVRVCVCVHFQTRIMLGQVPRPRPVVCVLCV